MTKASDKIVRNRAAIATRIAALPRPLVVIGQHPGDHFRGHVTYLEEARALGKSLVVGLNSDASARRLNKGADRPINALDDRLAVLAALESVSLVIPFDEDTPIELIKLVRPDHLVKGGDWPVEKIVGADFVRSYGGQSHSIAFRYERSTTELIRRIRGG